MSFIYNAKALFAMSYPFDIACDLSIVQLILLSLLLVVSVVLGLLSLVAFSLMKNNGAKIIYKLINVAAILMVIGYSAIYFRFWIVETFKVPLFSISTGRPLIIIICSSVIFIVFFNKYAKSERNNKILGTLFKYFTITTILGSIILSIKIVNYVIGEVNQSNFANSQVSRNLEKINQDNKVKLNGVLKNLPNIILVTFDALAAENMSLYGYQINTTPNIDALAKESYVFDNMIANSNWTRPSSASIIIGKYPSTHKILAENFATIKMSYNRENFASVLRENGYKNAAITSNPLSHPLTNMTYRDFDYLPDRITNWALLPPVGKFINLLPNKFFLTSSTSIVLLSDILGGIDMHLYKIMPWHYTEIAESPNLVFEKALDYISSVKSPFFIWLHIMPPHGPYLASKKFKYKLLQEKLFDNINSIINLPSNIHQSQTLIDKLRLRYDENIMYADDEFGKFIMLLKAKGFYENSMLIVSSDHGESFRKGYLGHGSESSKGRLYQQSIRVPLIIHKPEQKIGKRIHSNAEHVDIAPTILNLLDLNVPEWMEGEALTEYMYNNHTSKRPKYSMNLVSSAGNIPITEGAITVVKENYKFIFHMDENNSELYDLNNDPLENNNLVNAKKDIVTELKQLVIKRLFYERVKH